MRAYTSSLTGAIVGGFVGFLLAAPSTNVIWNLDIDLYLTDNTVIEIWTNSGKFIKKLIPYMHVKDPRDKYRKKRGVL